MVAVVEHYHALALGTAYDEGFDSGLGVDEPQVFAAED